MHGEIGRQAEAASLEEEAVRRRADALEEAARRLESAGGVRTAAQAAADEAHQLLADAADQAALVVTPARPAPTTWSPRAQRESATLRDVAEADAESTRAQAHAHREKAHHEAEGIVSEAREDAARLAPRGRRGVAGRLDTVQAEIEALVAGAAQESEPATETP